MFAPFTDCISEINITQVNNVKEIDVLSLSQYYRDEPALNKNDSIIGFPDDDNSALFKFKLTITDQTGYDGTKDVEIIVPLKYSSNFWRTLELINCEINLIITWSANCFIIANAIDGQVPKNAKIDVKLYASVVALSTEDNVKLLDKLKSGFNRTFNWNEYHSKATIQKRNQILRLFN